MQTDRELIQELMRRIGHGKKPEGEAAQYSYEWEETEGRILFRSDMGDIAFLFSENDPIKLQDISSQ